MTTIPRTTSDIPIVTLRTLLGATERNDGLEGSSGPIESETEQRYNEVVEKIRRETEAVGSDVLITVQDREASLVQSRMAESAEAGEALETGGLEAQFGEGAFGGDVWGWFKSLFDHIDQSRWHAIKRPSGSTPQNIADKGRIAVVGDWGTNLYGAPVSARSIKHAGSHEVMLHLGDIYYSGTESETKQRFLSAWPTGAAKLDRALNGNHEMYSGGFAYFDDILPRFKQDSSYFSLQNSHWLLIGLDTAHSDHDLDAQQISWLKTTVQNAGQRKVVLFSHHQPFSRLDKQGPKLQAALADLLQGKAITAWYWGHEHDCIVYDRHPDTGMLGRCIGHGGIPAPRKSIVRNAQAQQRLNGISWKRLDGSADAPGCVVLDGPNLLVPGEEEKFGPHGYLTLEFNGPELVERVHLPEGTEIYRAKVE